jgi:hypothetical protein
LIKTEENEVDRLLAMVAEIQANCNHTFLLPEELVLHPSLVAGVFLKQVFEIICSNCSLQMGKNSKETCPVCLFPMASLGFARPHRPHGDAMEIFFGPGEHLYYAPVLYRCSNCSHEVVDQVWDQ